ncbi:hypothetical protein SUGI_1007180 [Cryptomeria japonica]|nr:hypothetical protein SUGI_1007180 [Cryptomeria japonica]
MEVENNIATVKIDIKDGERQLRLEVNREHDSCFDQLQHDCESKEYRKRKTSASASIYRVPESMKKTNPEAYNPLVVFLGPFHHKRDDYKLQAVRRTLERLPVKNVEWLVSEVQKLDKEIRYSYEDSAIECDERALASIVTIDACFILEFLRMDLPNSSLVFHTQRAYNIKRREMIMDILKMENQIPLCILKRILQLELEDPVAVPTFLAQRLNDYMGSHFQGYPFTNKNNQELIAKLIQGGAIHLLDLSRRVIENFLSNSGSGCESATPVKCCDCNVYCTTNGVACFRRSWDDRIRWVLGHSVVDGSMIPSAEKLQGAGIKLKPSNRGKFHFKRRFFQSSTLYLPQITVDDDTEIFLRNLVALEECQIQEISPIKRLISGNVYLMDSLIDSREDVGLFRKANIIRNFLGSDKQVAKMFNALGVGITEVGEFQEVLKDVNEHYNSKVKVWMSEFRKEHCSSPWYIISLVAAVILVVLTLLQTIYTMESYFKT